MNTKTQRLKRIDQILADLPTINCKGKCWAACRRITRLSTLEQQRIIDTHGIDIVGEHDPCPALKDHRCSIYRERPAICHIWGLSYRPLACDHGCEPSRRLTLAEVFQILNKIDWLAGDISTDKFAWLSLQISNNPTIVELMIQAGLGNLEAVAVLNNLYKPGDLAHAAAQTT